MVDGGNNARHRPNLTSSYIPNLIQGSMTLRLRKSAFSSPIYWADGKGARATVRWIFLLA